MAIAARHDDLPRPGQPDRTPRISIPLMAAIAESFDREYLPNAVEGAVFRGTSAGACSRRLAYDWSGVEETNPAGDAARWRMNLGTMVHEKIDALVDQVWPGSEAEVTVSLTTDAGNIYGGRLDLLVVLDGKRIAVEIKTVSGYPYKLAASNFRGAPEGPKRGHVVQSAMNALAANADEMVVLYVGFEPVSPDATAYAGVEDMPDLVRVVAEWTFERDVFEVVAREELRRLDAIRAVYQPENPEKMPRRVPDDEGVPWTVTDPSSGNAVRMTDGQITDIKKMWNCNYCPFQDRCVADMVETQAT